MEARINDIISYLNDVKKKYGNLEVKTSYIEHLEDLDVDNIKYLLTIFKNANNENYLMIESNEIA